MKFLPLLNRVLIKKVVKSNTTAGGIILDKSNSKTLRGTVVSWGQTAFRESKDGLLKQPLVKLKEGQQVLLPEYGGTKIQEISNQNEEYILLKDSQILAFINHN